MLTRENFPYVFTLLIGVSGWTITEIADRLHSMNAIEYKVNYGQLIYKTDVDEHKDLNDRMFNTATFKLTNLSIENSHRKLNISIYIPEKENDSTMIRLKSKIGFSELLSIPGNYSEMMKARMVTYEIAVLPPATTYELKVLYDGRVKPEIRNVLQDSKLSGTFKLIESNCYTYVMKNDIEILLVLFVIWLVIISVYLLKVEMKPEKDS